jgi:hypothetical protein
MGGVPLPSKDEMTRFLREASGELLDIANLETREDNRADLFAISKNAESLAKEIVSRGVDSVMMRQLQDLADDVDQMAVRFEPHKSSWLRLKAIAATATQAIRESRSGSRP